MIKPADCVEICSEIGFVSQDIFKGPLSRLKILTRKSNNRKLFIGNSQGRGQICKPRGKRLKKEYKIENDFVL